MLSWKTHIPISATSGSSTSGPASRNAKNGQMSTAMPTADQIVSTRRPTRSDSHPQNGVDTSDTAEMTSTACSPASEPDGPRAAAR